MELIGLHNSFYPFVPDVKYGISQAQLSTFLLIKGKQFFSNRKRIWCCYYNFLTTGSPREGSSRKGEG